MYKILVAGDSFMNVDIFGDTVYKVIKELDPEVEIVKIQWEFEGYQLGRMMGIKREIREFAGKPEELAKLVKDIDALFIHVAPVTKQVLESGKKLKVVACARGGPVNIDIDAATMLGIPVINAPGRNAEAVAEYVIGLIIAYTRNIIKSHILLKKGTWSEDFYHYDKCGDELEGKVIGLIGFGRVGRKLVERLKGFNVRIIAYDPYVSKEQMASYNVESVDLNTLMKESDIISVHARLTPETHHLISEKEFKIAKRTALFINTARGEIVDENALIKALKEGWIAGAALDVFENEPLPKDHPLLQLDNVILTPHIAGASRTTVIRTAKMIAEDVKRVLAGEKPKNCINPEVFTRH
ncbi:MAG: 2-hydroxyacid dehydrogenase [Candidatus Methanomethylicaceae archaeon]